MQRARLGPVPEALGHPRLMHIASHGFYVPPADAGAASADVLSKTLEHEVESDTKGRGVRSGAALMELSLASVCLSRRGARGDSDSGCKS